MMVRFAWVCSLGMAAALASSLGFSRQTVAGGSVAGTVKATGLSSNADAVVYIEQVTGSFTPALASMDQRQMQFTPHVLPVLSGTTVKFLNSDPTPHNVFSPDYEKFNLGTWPQGQTKGYAFGKCTKFPCVYAQLCRVHPEMEGFVVVLQNPFFAVSDTGGHFAIEGVPAGSYNVGIWHQKLKAQAKAVTVQANARATLDFTLNK